MLKALVQIILTLILLCHSGFSWGQELISSSGNIHESASYSISWSLGELVIDTHSAHNMVVTNGFHQPGILVTNVYNSELPDLIINLYPNPTSDVLYLESASDKRFEYYLFNSEGKILSTDLLQSDRMQIDFQQFTSGIYLLRILSDKELVGVYQIIKK